MRNNLLLTTMVLATLIKALSTVSVPKVDTLIFLEIDIRSGSSHQVTMAGVVKDLDSLELSIRDTESLIESFYQKANYVPNFLIYDDLINELAKTNNDSTLAKYVGQGQRLMSSIPRNGREIRLILDSGENAFIQVTKVRGLFFVCEKKDIQIPSVSNEISMSYFKSIDKFFVPLEIFEYQKPSREDLRQKFRK